MPFGARPATTFSALQFITSIFFTIYNVTIYVSDRNIVNITAGPFLTLGLTTPNRPHPTLSGEAQGSEIYVKTGLARVPPSPTSFCMGE